MVWKLMIFTIDIKTVIEKMIHSVVLHMVTGIRMALTIVYIFNDQRMRIKLQQDIINIRS